MNSLKVLSTFLFLSALICSCSKENIPITKIPIDELTSSYVILGESTIELPREMHNSVILERTANSLRLKSDAVLNGLTKGGFLVSSIETERDEFLFRKIVEIDSSGGELNLTTIPANVVQAYKGYYIDSKLSGLISSREPANLSTVFEAGSTIFNDIIENALEPDHTDWGISVDFVIEGIPNFKAIHPNTAYEIFVGNGTSINKADSDLDGIWDVAEVHFNDLNSVIDSNGLYTVEIAQFGIQKIDKSLKYSLSPDLDDLDNLQVSELANQVKDASKALSNKEKASHLSFKYFPVGSIGAFTINAVLGPVLEIEAECSMFLDFMTTYPNRITIQFGHLDWNSSIPSADIDIKFLDDNNGNGIYDNDVSFSHIFSDPSSTVTTGINGNLGMKMGFSVGVAGSTGEANTVGASLGFLVPITVNAGFSAQGAVSIADAYNFDYANTSFAGELCTDVSIGASVIIFSDANLSVTTLGDLLDYQLEVPPNLLPPLALSLFSWQENYTDDGLCWGYNSCSGINLSQFDIALDDNGTDGKRIEFLFESELTNEFEVEISSSGSVKRLDGKFDFNNRYSLDVFLSDAYISGVTNGTLEVKAIVSTITGSFICDKPFLPEVGLFVNGCDGTYRTAGENSGDHKATNLSGETISYFKYEDATNYLEGIQVSLPSLEEAQSFFLVSCSNPTGWRIINPLTADFRFVDRNETYVWIQRQGNLDNVLKVSYTLNGSTFSYDFETLNAAPSVMAALING